MTEEQNKVNDKTTSRRFKITFEGNFALEKYSNRPYYQLDKKEKKNRRFETVKILAISINALVTLLLLAYQAFGWKLPLY